MKDKILSVIACLSCCKCCRGLWGGSLRRSFPPGDPNATYLPDGGSPNIESKTFAATFFITSLLTRWG